jgi:hypothetical protein
MVPDLEISKEYFTLECWAGKEASHQHQQDGNLKNFKSNNVNVNYHSATDSELNKALDSLLGKKVKAFGYSYLTI